MALVASYDLYFKVDMIFLAPTLLIDRFTNIFKFMDVSSPET